MLMHLHTERLNARVAVLARHISAHMPQIPLVFQLVLRAGVAVRLPRVTDLAARIFEQRRPEQIIDAVRFVAVVVGVVAASLSVPQAVPCPIVMVRAGWRIWIRRYRAAGGR